MFELNDYVVFGSTGVCQITEIINENFGTDTEREYYVLNPVHANSCTIYIPTDKEDANIRRIMTKDEIIELVKVMPDIDGEWITDDQTRKAAFADMIQSCDPESLVKLTKMMYTRQKELEKDGKKLSNSDTDMMKKAEQVLHNEFALVLDIKLDQVVPFILGQIKV